MTARPPLAEAIRETGHLLGLDAVGIAPGEPGPQHAFLAEWWAKGFGGTMDYLGRRAEERMDPRRVLPGCRSILVGAMWTPEPEAMAEDRGASGGDEPARGRVARYAGGEDYHGVLLERMRALEAALPALVGGAVASRSYVDTGPVLERAAAARAGLGWIGKNTLLIHPDLGSHVMLGVVLTDLALAPDPIESDHCGTCRACLDVCPTDAFPEPYVLDATRCLSYTTIELREGIPDALRAAQGDHVFGCDLCQTVCPWNRSRPRAWPADPLASRARLASKPEWRQPTLAWLLELDAESFAEASRHTALRRTGLRGLLRNALVAAGNAADPALLPQVERLAAGSDPMLAEHAAWARAQILAAD